MKPMTVCVCWNDERISIWDTGVDWTGRLSVVLLPAAKTGVLTWTGLTAVFFRASAAVVKQVKTFAQLLR